MLRPFCESTTTEPQFLLVMTATIVPAAGANIRHTDPELRRSEYREALRFWLREPHPDLRHVLFLENSGADLSEFHEIAANENPLEKTVEILSVPGNVIPEGRNYGYTEMELLDEGLARSRLRHETSHLVKVTGRLTFPTLGLALDRTPRPFDVLLDFRKLGFPRRGFDANTQIFVVSHAFYDAVLRGSREEMNATSVRLLEHLIAHKISPYRGRPNVYLRFPINVEPVGVSGFTAKTYATPKAIFVRRVRAILRRMAPDFWF